MLAELISLLAPFKDMLGHIRTSRREREQAHQDAITALCTALTETRIYLQRVAVMRSGFKIYKSSSRLRTTQEIDMFTGANSPPFTRRDLRAQERLARLWSNASVKLSAINEDLAVRCNIKSEYWTNPDAWSDDEIRRARIELESINQEARELL